jgi:hypothetical protein
MPYWLLSILTNLVEVVMVFIAFYISLLGQMRKGFNSLSPGIIIFGVLFLFILIIIQLGHYLLMDLLKRKTKLPQV